MFLIGVIAFCCHKRWCGHALILISRNNLKQEEELNLEQDNSSPHCQNIIVLAEPQTKSLKIGWVFVFFSLHLTVHHQRWIPHRVKVYQLLETFSRLFIFSLTLNRSSQTVRSATKTWLFPSRHPADAEYRCICVHLKRPNAQHELFNGWPWSLCETAALASLRAKPLAAGSLDRELSSLFS